MLIKINTFMNTNKLFAIRVFFNFFKIFFYLLDDF